MENLPSQVHQLLSLSLNISMDFLASNSTSRLIRRVMVLFPPFKGILKSGYSGGSISWSSPLLHTLYCRYGEETGIWWISGQRWSHSDTVLLTENPVCPLDKWLQQLMISRRWRLWNSNLRARLRCKIISLFGGGFSDDKLVLIDEPELGLNPLVKQEFLKFLLTESKNIYCNTRPM